MMETESVPAADLAHDGVFVIGCWAVPRCALLRVTATVDLVDRPTRSMTTRAEVHGALDAWLDELGVEDRRP